MIHFAGAVCGLALIRHFADELSIRATLPCAEYRVYGLYSN